MTKSFLILFSIGFFLFSCSKKEEEIVIDISSEYAGLVVGKYVVYNVDSITYDDFDGSEELASYQIRETVDSKFIDLEGDEAFKIIRYRRDADTLAWNLIDVWSSKLTTTNFQKIEENIKYVKLIFPAKIDKTWNGNAMNNIGQWDYEYITVDQEEVIGGVAFGKVLNVLQLDALDNIITPQLFEEKFAKGVGMVYKRSLSRTRKSLSDPWLGYDITMTLSSYGG